MSCKRNDVCSLSFGPADVAELLLCSRQQLCKDRGRKTVVALSEQHHVAEGNLGLTHEIIGDVGIVLRNTTKDQES